jgi:MFS-type transporter involved in bile tolerance (Atg22 family)
MGAQESIMRAAIAEMVPMNKRSTAYGIFNAGFGLFWFLGSALMGILYDVSVTWFIVFSIVAQLASIPFFILIRRRPRRFLG